MKKGYSIVKQDHLIKKNLNEIDANKELMIYMTGGEITTRIIEMKGNKDE
jgi:exonuclease VII large subunit